LKLDGDLLWRRDGRHRHALNKTPVVSLVCRETSEVRSTAVANVTGDTIYSAFKGNVSMRRSHLQTDEAHGYSSVSCGPGQHGNVCWLVTASRGLQGGPHRRRLDTWSEQ
jgi:hypothetical protein